MEEAQDLLDQGQDGLAGDVMESVGEPKESASEVDQSHESQGGQAANDPLYVQKRLKQQKRTHEREMREMKAQISHMQSLIGGQAQNPQPPMNDPYMPQGSEEERIHKAVSYALQHKEMEERKAKDAMSRAEVDKHYQDLDKHLENMSDKYDDFDDVVRGNHVPFTPAMRDFSLTMLKSGPGSAGEVLYHLGKNPDELERISKLHPVKQAAEMLKLSHALVSGGQKEGSAPRPLGNIKNNPVSNSRAVNDKTPVSSIRQRMKAGNWK